MGRAGTILTGVEDLLASSYGFTDPHAELVNVSENETYAVTEGTKRRAALRYYRPHHRSDDEIVGELNWLKAIDEDGCIRVAPSVPTTAGALFAIDRNGRRCALFDWHGGTSPDEAAMLRWFGSLGRICALLHDHADRSALPGLRRPNYDLDALVGRRGMWGDWRLAPGIEIAETRLIERILVRIASRLEAASGLDTGLIHGDLRLANLLIDGDRLTLIDFDDCGTGWRLYDLATALSLAEDAPDAPEAANLWLDAYGQQRAIPSPHRKLVPDLVMLRRIQVLAWFASHADTDIARTFGPDAIAATLEAARLFDLGKSTFSQ